MAETSIGDSMKKRNRPRRKDVLRRLKEQVEFYFSDINLNRDRFLNHRITESEDGFVSIEMIAGFNRMKDISEDLSLIVKAMRRSDMLEVSENGDMVRRATPVGSVENTNDRTLYVEDLPPSASIDVLKSDFSSCGTVEYVNLPRVRETKEVKGYAWITFADPSGVLKALKVFDNFESGLEPLHPPPASTTQEKRHKEEDRTEGDEQAKGMQVLRGDETPRIQEESRPSRKRSHKGSMAVMQESRSVSKAASVQDSPETGASPTKHTSTQSSNTTPVSTDPSAVEHDSTEQTSCVKTTSEEPPTKKKKIHKAVHEEMPEDAGLGDSESKTKSRKHKKKKSKKSTESTPVYKVLHQLEWIRLKKLYLKLQKQEMSKIKSIMSGGTVVSDPVQVKASNDDAFYDPLESGWPDSSKRGPEKGV
jgi:La-related protein 7